jgi:ribosomal protein S2
MLFINAVKFLHSISRKPNILFVFSGTPFGDDNLSIWKFKKIKQNYKFFPNERWSSGYISKNYKKVNFVLVVYDVELNNTAYKEGVNANIPIVGFVTPSNDIRGIDYPVLFNLKNNQQWYVKLLLSIFHKN